MKTLWHLLGHPLLISVHFSPPCGTCSRARDKTVPNQTGGGPPPLRSNDFPEGFPDLSTRLPVEFARVTAANSIYNLIVEIAMYLIKRNISWALEHPRNSYMWKLVAMLALITRTDVDKVTFQHCMFGGGRPKWTTFHFFPLGLFSSLSRTCDNTHEHEPWGFSPSGGFATAAETVYPTELCEAIRTIIFDKLHVQRLQPLPVLRARGEPLPKPIRDDRAAAGLQPRGLRGGRLIPEFKRTLWVPGAFSPTDARSQIGHCWDACVHDGLVIPKGAKTISTTSSSSLSTSSPSSGGPLGSSASSWRTPTRACLHDIGVNNLDVSDLYIGRAHRAKSGKHLAASIWANPFKLRDCLNLNDCLAKYRAHLSANSALIRRLPDLSGKRLLCHCAAGAACHGDVIREFFITHLLADVPLAGLTIGIHYEPSEFILAARRAKHPFDALDLPDPLVQCILFKMSSAAQVVIDHRNRALKYWKNHAQHLEDKEAALHRAMHADVSSIMKDKRILLFGDMLAHVNFPVFKRLIHLLTVGFPVAGTYPQSEVLPASPRTAALNLTDLWRMAKELQEKLLARPGASDDADLDAEVFTSTLSEVDKGWLKGPFTSADLTARLGCWVPSRRFGVRQGGKIRCIDDYAASRVNDALTAFETVSPDDLCSISVNVRGHMDAFSSSSSTRSSSAPFSSSQLHPDHAESRLLVRMWDLESAYRQLARSPSHSSLTIVAAWNPTDKQYAFFEQPPLGFGASASVISFNWVAAALKSVLVEIFTVALTNFYDDFTIIEIESLARNARDVVEEVFSLLGWRLKELPDFAAESSPLGAVLNLERCHQGLATITNKASRVAELVEVIDSFGALSKIPSDALPRLRGRLLFARSLTFGRAGGVALRALGTAIEQGKHQRHIQMNEQLLRALLVLRRHLLGARPREIHVAVPTPLLLFTDGAFEPTRAGTNIGSIGAILLDPLDSFFEFFMFRLTDDQLSLLLGAAKTAIFHLELLPVLVSRRTWSRRFAARPFIAFNDNEAAKAALVASYSGDPIGVQILSLIAEQDVSDGALGWYERVPTSSNPADAPSRLVPPERIMDFNAPVEIDVKETARQVLKEIRADAVTYDLLTGADGRAFAPGAA